MTLAWTKSSIFQSRPLGQVWCALDAAVIRHVVANVFPCRQSVVAGLFWFDESSKSNLALVEPVYTLWLISCDAQQAAEMLARYPGDVKWQC